MIGRVIIVTIAAFIGAGFVFMFVPTVQPVGVNPDMPVFKRDDEWTPRAGDLLPRMSEELRRDRARQLIGEPFRWLCPGRLINTKALIKRGPDAMEEAMDECYLLADEKLREQHFAAIQDQLDAGVPESEIGRPRISKTELQSCKNILDAYT